MRGDSGVLGVVNPRFRGNGMSPGRDPVRAEPPVGIDLEALKESCVNRDGDDNEQADGDAEFFLH